jgi:hypothetical protein
MKSGNGVNISICFLIVVFHFLLDGGELVSQIFILLHEGFQDHGYLFRVSVLGELNAEGHQKRDDGRAGVDD